MKRNGLAYLCAIPRICLSLGFWGIGDMWQRASTARTKANNVRSSVFPAKGCICAALIGRVSMPTGNGGIPSGIVELLGRPLNGVPSLTTPVFGADLTLDSCRDSGSFEGVLSRWKLTAADTKAERNRARTISCGVASRPDREWNLKITRFKARYIGC